MLAKLFVCVLNVCLTLVMEVQSLDALFWFVVFWLDLIRERKDSSHAGESKRD